MAYSSKHGRRPHEYASKAAHSQVINDPTVQAFLARCHVPTAPEATGGRLVPRSPYTPVSANPIRHIIAVDGGYSVVPVAPAYPSATVCFFQFGALIFSVADLARLTHQPFIAPQDMARLKQVQRLKLVLPVRGVALREQASLRHSVRQALYDFLLRPLDDTCLMETLRWLLFQEYHAATPTWQLSSCPHCGEPRIPLQRAALTPAYTCACPYCGADIYLTDVFRLHERIEEELGAGLILSDTCTAIEQLILVHLIRVILALRPQLLAEILFIKDGPLAFFGPPLPLQGALRVLIKYLFDQQQLYLAGLEKSGLFVEHADQIAGRLAPGSVLLLNNAYIYRYIQPGKVVLTDAYGHSTYYGQKFIFKTHAGQMYVITLPVPQVKIAPTMADLRNLDVILTNIEQLRCDMYDSALVPVALVNQLVSLAHHPSARILQRFAREVIQSI